VDVINLKSEINQTVFDWWHSQCANGELPQCVDFSALASVAMACVVLDVSRNPDDFRYRFIGSRVDEFMSASYTGLYMSVIAGQGQGSQIWSACEKVRDTQVPLSSDVPYIGPVKELVNAEDIILPLADTPGEVTQLLVGIDFLNVDTGTPFQAPTISR
jgi:PAS domain